MSNIAKEYDKDYILFGTDCGQLPVGYKVTDTIFTGNAITVTCDEETGYSGTPQPNTATCNINGTWSVLAFTGCGLGED